jgi:hypothetical protein
MDPSLIKTQKHPLEVDLLHELFEYRDGHLYRRCAVANCKAGERVGCLNQKGYLIVSINAKKYGVHCLIWLMHGNPPVKMLDHINGDRADNRIENLRAADSARNQYNSKLNVRNTSGIKGVSWNAREKKWSGQVWFQRKIYSAGYFANKQECAEAVAKLRSELHGEFARQESIAI